MNTVAPPRTPTRLITPEILAGLGNLELVARAVVDGMLNGLHRSDVFGFSQEFAEYRDYVPGDDPRFVDWNAYARTGRPYVKRFEGETNTRLMLMLDVSASMGFGARDVSKLDYSRWLAAALAWLAHRQHDAVGLFAFHDTVAAFQPPSARGVARERLFHTLDGLRAASGTDWPAALRHLGARVPRRGVLAVFSDFYCAPDVLGQALRGLCVRGHDVFLVHVLDPAEREPDLGRGAALRDAETAEVMEVDGQELRSGYPERLADHERGLRRAAASAGADYVRVDTDQPLDRALFEYLRFRARQS
ncbi:MAG: DUF58 domain-containing protein [Gammaproteobacteria bacterium]|nr:DUF58 domain-containing protein [Gammaproteobacteria bacterium]